MNTTQFVIGYLAVTYLVAAVWFLFLERKDGFLKWRVIASAAAPLAVPVLFLALVVLKVLEAVFKWDMKRTNNKAQKKAAKNESPQPA